jgi:hypothetical protein
MNNNTDLIEYLLRLGDSALIQGQRRPRPRRPGAQLAGIRR